jgi:hypothetical protein
MEDIVAVEDIDVSSLRKPLDVADIGKDYIALHHVFGADPTRRNNISLIADDKIVYASGNTVIFENIYTAEKDFLLAIDEGGVGCVAVHPSRKYFAVGCKGFQPNVYVYEYPSLKVKFRDNYMVVFLIFNE